MIKWDIPNLWLKILDIGDTIKIVANNYISIIMNKEQYQEIYTFIMGEVKRRYSDVKHVYVDIDEKNQKINVLVVTKEFNPDLETKIFDIENDFEKKYKMQISDFKIVSSLAAAYA